MTEARKREFVPYSDQMSYTDRILNTVQRYPARLVRVLSRFANWYTSEFSPD